MNHGSLFSGIGGFDLAAEWMGWNNMFHCEINPFCQQVLKHYWPNAECYDDIKKTDFTKWRGTIDIVSGGFPCQPYSHAGQRKGKDDDRHLWPEMLRAIREIEPSYIVGENVRGLISWNGGMVFDEVQTDMELAGYEVAAVVIPAAGVNAPHGRDRVWFVAKNTRINGCIRGKFEKDGTKIWEFGDIGTRGGKRVCLSTGFITDTEHNTPSTNGGTIRGTQSEIWGDNTGDVFGGFCDDGYVADTTCIGLRGQSDGIGKPGLIGETRPPRNWENFPTQPPICGGNDGLPTQLDGITFPKWRNESIKGYGNAVVPQVVYQIFQCLMNLESKSNA